MTPLTLAAVALIGGLGSVALAWGLAVLLQPRRDRRVIAHG